MKVSNDWLHEFFKFHNPEPTERELAEAEYYGHVHWQVSLPNGLAPRSPRLEYLLNIGRGLIDNLFTKGDLDAKGEIDLFFPERWLTVQEQYLFFQMIKQCASFEHLTRVRIVTQSPFIIANFLKEQVRILTFGDT